MEWLVFKAAWDGVEPHGDHDAAKAVLEFGIGNITTQFGE